MKVKVVKSHKKSKEFEVELQQGVQYFRLDYSASKEECQWMAKNTWGVSGMWSKFSDRRIMPL